MAAYCVEYAKSNRASCKVCKAKIDKDDIRIGTITAGPGDYDMTAWRHLDCQKRPKALSDLSELDGLSSLTAADQAKLLDWFASSGQGQKRAAGDADGTGVDLATADVKKLKAPELKAALKAAGLETSGKKAEQVARLQEVADRAKQEARCSAMKNDDLKEECRLNGQKVGGTKQELIERVVDGSMYGGLPRCPECGGAVLRVRYPSKYGHGGSGAYHCPGFYDDDVFKKCKFTQQTVDRPKWRALTGSGASGTSAAAPAPPAAKSAKKARADKETKKTQVAMPGDDD